MKYILLFLLLTTPAMASHTGTYKDYAGPASRTFEMTVYSAEEIKDMRVSKYCSTGNLVIFGNSTWSAPYIFTNGMYAVGDDCRKIHVNYARGL